MLANEPRSVIAETPGIFKRLFSRNRYKVMYGGRGGAKSWSIARALILRAYSEKLRILCAREYQTSISDSVMSLLVKQISELGLTAWFSVTKTKITSLTTGSEFIFKGLHFSIDEIKSTEGIDICWVEEAQVVSKRSWDVLRPTIRKEGSEIWVSFNPELETDPTYKMFITENLPDSWVQKVSWSDNPYLSTALEAERRISLENDPEAYDWIWNGNPRKISRESIFGDRLIVMTFERPQDIKMFYGIDWGFFPDPMVLIEFFVVDDCLYINDESYSWSTSPDESFDVLYTKVPGVISGTDVVADNARPEMIKQVRKSAIAAGKMISIREARKWPGCVEDRIGFIRGFKQIFVHERCDHFKREAPLYKYKTDLKTGEILPVPIDKHNHGWDAIGYGLDGYILTNANIASRIKAYLGSDATEEELRKSEEEAKQKRTKALERELRRKGGNWRTI